MPHPNFYKKGFTLIEIIVVLFIIAMLTAIVLPKFSEMRSGAVLKSATSDILSTLTRARSQTLSSVDSSAYGVHFEPQSVTIFKGTSYDSNSPDNEVISVVAPASITSINLTDSATSLYFARLTGLPDKTGTLTVTNGSLSKTITILATGAISAD